MFEKEAQYYAFDEVKHKQEWYIKHPERSIDEDYEDIKKHWGKGAEFGYNKANEWHYVKDEIFPIHSNRVLVFTDEGVGFGIFGLDNKRWYTYDTGFEVIAWKEIVLPELKESELMSFELKEQPAEQLAEYENRINEIPLVIDPCKMCKNEERKTEEQIEKCRLCCWYYASSFEVKRKEK